MTLDNIAALFIQPPVGAWSDQIALTHGTPHSIPADRRADHGVAFRVDSLPAALPLFVACTSTLLLSAAILAHASHCAHA